MDKIQYLRGIVARLEAQLDVAKRELQRYEITDQRTTKTKPNRRRLRGIRS